MINWLINEVCRDKYQSNQVLALAWTHISYIPQIRKLCLLTQHIKLVLCLGAEAASLDHEDWHQWKGNHRDADNVFSFPPTPTWQRVGVFTSTLSLYRISSYITHPGSSPTQVHPHPHPHLHGSHSHPCTIGYIFLLWGTLLGSHLCNVARHHWLGVAIHIHQLGLVVSPWSHNDNIIIIWKIIRIQEENPI